MATPSSHTHTGVHTLVPSPFCLCNSLLQSTSGTLCYLSPPSLPCPSSRYTSNIHTFSPNFFAIRFLPLSYICNFSLNCSLHLSFVLLTPLCLSPFFFKLFSPPVSLCPPLQLSTCLCFLHFLPPIHLFLFPPFLLLSPLPRGDRFHYHVSHGSPALLLMDDLTRILIYCSINNITSYSTLTSPPPSSVSSFLQLYPFYPPNTLQPLLSFSFHSAPSFLLFSPPCLRFIALFSS